MTVYVVIQIWYSDTEVMGTFSTRDRAQDWINENNSSQWCYEIIPTLIDSPGDTE